MSTATATQFLTDDLLRTKYPTLFADRPHASRSERYEHIPTSDIIGAMRGEGFQPVKVGVARVRASADTAQPLESRLGFEKHLIRFRQIDAAIQLGEVLPEIVLVNSHDGSSAYQLSAGLFRLICTNGLVISEMDFGTIKVPHKGRDATIQRVLRSSFDVLENAGNAVATVQQWQQLTLTDSEQYLFAMSARGIRFADSEGNIDTPIQPEQLLTPRRANDAGNDLWRVFNRIQENCIKGGISARTTNTPGRRGRWTTTRETTGIDGQLTINKRLWALAQETAALKLGLN